MDVPLDETLRRHAGRPLSAKVGEELLREWYAERDLLPHPVERVIGQDSSIDDTVALLMAALLP